jgi:hypothetical protein
LINAPIRDDVVADPRVRLLRPETGLAETADDHQMHIRRERGRAAGVSQPLLRQREFERIGAEPAQALGDGESQIPCFVQLAEVLVGKDPGAVDRFGTGGDRASEALGHRDELGLTRGLGIVHAVARGAPQYRIDSISPVDGACVESASGLEPRAKPMRG